MSGKIAGVLVFLAWNIMVLMFPTVIVSMGGSWLWFLPALFLCMHVIPEIDLSEPNEE